MSSGRATGCPAVRLPWIARGPVTSDRCLCGPRVRPEIVSRRLNDVGILAAIAVTSGRSAARKHSAWSSACGCTIGANAHYSACFRGPGLQVLIAVNCAIVTRGLSGTARGVQHFVECVSRRADTDVERLWPTRKLRRSRVWNAGVQAWWDMSGAAAAAGSADVLVSPCNIGRARGRQRHILVVLDTMALDHPEWFDRGFAAYARALGGVSVAGASVILVPSDYTKRCVAARWPSAPPTVVARYPFTIAERDLDAVDRRRILMVGATEVHKRHDLAIEAVRAARERSGEDLHLVIVGPRGRAEAMIEVAVREADPRAAWIERRVNITDVELNREYDVAGSLIHTSAGEGYGLPVGEAAARGMPSVHSGAGSLPEIAPGAVDYPERAESYSAAILALFDSGAYAAASEAALHAVRQVNSTAYAAAVDRAITVAVS